MAKWMMYTTKGDYESMGRLFGISPVVAQILVNRGLREPEEVKAFLHPSRDQFHDGSLLKDMDKAVAMLSAAIDAGVHIRIIGDYDADGVNATYILHQGLLHCGAKASFAIPHRVEDGYGVSMNLVDRCAKDGVGLIITCDNGISAREEIAYAKSLGIDVIVTDHHDVPFDEVKGKRHFILPPADAIVNPKQADCGYPCKKLCGATVAWKVIEQLYIARGLSAQEADVFLENAAFATVCDIMELVEEYRAFVALGLQQLQVSANLGMRALIRESGLEGKAITAYHLGFVLGPCINATGRLASASKALELFEAADEVSATALAHELVELNAQRKLKTEEGVNKACELVEARGNQSEAVLVAYVPGVHESITGLIAGRLRERYDKPVFALTDGLEEGTLKGSGRSMEGFSMSEEMSKCKELFVKYGGHPMAAGLTIMKDNLEAFIRAINENTEVKPGQLESVVHIDVVLSFNQATMDLIEELEVLAPNGNGNVKPVFAQKGIRVYNYQSMGKEQQYRRATLDDGSGVKLRAVYFGREADRLDALVAKGEPISMIFEPDINEFNGRCSVQLRIKDFQ